MKGRCCQNRCKVFLKVCLFQTNAANWVLVYINISLFKKKNIGHFSGPKIQNTLLVLCIIQYFNRIYVFCCILVTFSLDLILKLQVIFTCLCGCCFFSLDIRQETDPSRNTTLFPYTSIHLPLPLPHPTSPTHPPPKALQFNICPSVHLSSGHAKLVFRYTEKIL